jgi:hypothetical protein
MLNCTTRKQVEKVLPEFKRRWPTPQCFMESHLNEVIELIKPLGFANRRCKNLLAMTRHYLTSPWSRASDLPGIGEYGQRAFEIFCEGTVGTEPPQDGSLARYWHWLTSARHNNDTLVLQHRQGFVSIDEETHAEQATLNPRTHSEQLAVSVEGAAA